MNDRMYRFSQALALTAALAASGPALAQAADADGYSDGYQDGAYGRIRFSEGGATILRADGQNEGRDRSGVNAPIFPGDSVRTDGGQRTEVELAAGTIVRLDRSTEMVFQSMPDPYGKYQDNVVLVLRAGTARLHVRLADKEEFRIDTQAGSVYLLGDGEFRIDADPRGTTSVASLRGVAEVVGAEGSVLVRGGSRTQVSAGQVPDDPRSYTAFASDGFDRWCESRDAAYREPVNSADSGGYDEVPSEVQPYYGELSSHGEWVTVPTYGRVWYPTGVYSGWRPYYDGYWAYGPGGYFWVSSEPWGWAPYRYGSWQYVGGYGWCWAPGRVFGGAWVSWSWGSAYLGWAPLDYWGYPCWRSGGYYRYGYYDPDCWTFVNYDHVYAHDVRRYAVPVKTVGRDVRDATITTRAPRVPPSRLATSRDARTEAIRSARQDRAATMRPTPVAESSRRRLTDMQDEALRRSVRATSPAIERVRDRANDRRSVTESPRRNEAQPQRATPQENRFPRRLTADPRGQTQRAAPRTEPNAGRSDSRENVRELYQRMSKPRETRGNDNGRTADRVDTPRQQARPQQQPQRSQQQARPQQQSQRPQQQARPQQQQQRSQQQARPQQQPQRSQQQARPQQAPQRAPQQARPQSSQRAPKQAPRPSASQGRSQGSPKSKDAPKSQGNGGQKR